MAKLQKALATVDDLKAAMEKERIFTQKRVDDVRFDLTRFVKGAEKARKDLETRIRDIQARGAKPAPQPEPPAPQSSGGVVEEEITSN